MKLERHSNGQLVSLGRKLGGGGEGTIYAVARSPWVAKVYHRPDAENARKLAAMLEHPPDDPTAADGSVSIAWPVDLLRDEGGTVVGFLMPRVQGAQPLHQFYNPKARRDRYPFFNYLYLHRTARNLAAAVSSLHGGGYVIGDVNESNILASKTALVTLVDTDSFQVRDRHRHRLYPCPVGKPEFTPPELQGQSFRALSRTPQHDRFGLAVLIFQLLMEGTHPFAGVYMGSGEPPPIEARIGAGEFPYGGGRSRYRPMPLAPPFASLHPQLQRLFRRCFVDGHSNPYARPPARDWIEALEAAERALVVCPRNNQHRYDDRLSTCPWCDRARTLRGRDPFPSPEEVRRQQQQRRARSQPTKRPVPATAVPAVPALARSPAPAYPITFGNPLPTALHSFHTMSPGVQGLWAELARCKTDLLLGSIVLAGAAVLAVYLANPPARSAIPAVPAVAETSGDRGLAFQPILQKNVRANAVRSLAIAPDAELLATAGFNGEVKVWRLPEGELLQTLPPLDARALSFSEGGKVLLVATETEAIAWPVGKSDPPHRQPHALEEVFAITGQDKNRFALLARQLTTTVLWRGDSQQTVAADDAIPEGAILLPASEAIAVLHDGKLRFVSPATGETRRVVTLQGEVEPQQAALSSEGRWLAAADDRTLLVWDVATGELRGREAIDGTSAIAFGDENTLAAGDRQGTVRVWQLGERPAGDL